MDFVGLVRTLPASKVAFGYGSGVFHQAGYSKEDAPMVDLVIGVQDALAWHTENMTKNPEHYSAFARAAGPRAVAWMQSSLGAGLWYNTLVVIPPSVSGAAPGQHMKYGIATVEALQRDLVDWESLYVAGRMHKPVRVILDDTGDAFTAAMERNRRAAVAAALLQLPESFTVRDFLVAVAGLSYAGDFRMVFGENPRKVENIVDGQFEQLASIYWPLLHDDFRDSVSLSGLEGDGAHSRAQDAAEPPRPSLLVRQGTSPAARLRLIQHLPAWVGDAMASRAAAGLEAPSLSNAPTVPRAAMEAASAAARRMSMPRFRAGDGASAGADPAATPGAGAMSWTPGHWAARSPFRHSHHDVTMSRAALGVVGLAAKTAAAAARRGGRRRPAPELRLLEAELARAGDASDLAARLLRPTLATVVARHAATQSIKGLVSAGPVKSATYSAAKLRKWAAAVMGGGSSPRRLQAMSLGLVGLATAAVSGVIGAHPPPRPRPSKDCPQ
ncbi:hypothetical protein FNF27_02929 [Cafeteria roenbergensis]|uniref:Phosphatidate cytidylyltransferase, mitochondrial n=2 Tax=Cafeteria roenbergensis TaxID=33653 RepID=A0A5A8EDB3_CAFRO|nr:hypothetical protein FNF27_02929 [Cafeteria roenbergensis]